MSRDQRRIGIHIHGLQVEAVLLLRFLKLSPGLFAEMTARAGVQDEPKWTPLSPRKEPGKHVPLITHHYGSQPFRYLLS